MTTLSGSHQGTLESLLSRLETVTSRLENIQGGTGGEGSVNAHPTSSAGPGAGAGSTPASSSSVADYKSLTGPAVAALLEAAQPLGAEILKASELVEKAFLAQAGVVAAIAQCKKPTPNELPILVAPVAEHMQAATAMTEGRRSAVFNHQKVVAESLHALSWMVYTGPNCGLSLPPQHVEESWQSAEFFANKVMMEFRNADSRHVDWVKALKQLFQQLKAYVKQHHMAGPSWNPRGVPLTDFKADKNASAASSPGPAVVSASAPRPPPPGPSKGGPAAPPPPPPGSLFQPKSPTAAAPAASTSSSGMSAVFSELNKGGNVTSGLKKVTDDMKTKNRADRSGAVPSSAPSSSTTTNKATATKAPVQAPPKLELVLGRKWSIENHTDNRSLIVDQTDPKQSVYIFNCTNCTVQVQGKVNAITLDSCTRTGLVFQDLVSSCEVVNCTSVEVQSTGIMPTIAIDKTDGIALYLSEASLGVAITTAKSSAINVVVPGNGESDPLELPVPEQFVSTFRDGKLLTEAVTHSGA
ncbi:TPA: hypothetical protein ACH3X2_006334 [Trebouxia sp. C0005]